MVSGVNKPAPRGQTALITGASGGIGYELAVILAQEGFHVVLVARDGQKLTSLAKNLQQNYGITATVIAKDLSAAQAADDIARELERAAVRVDVLINNAGFGTHGFFAEADLSEQLNMIQVNIGALTRLSGLFLPGMIKRRSGKILNVASTAAFQPGPFMAVYYATKAYVLSFSEALANELQGTGISVTALCPGPTTTGFQQRAGVGHTKLMQGRIADAKSVALAGYRAMMQGRSLIIPGFRNRLLAFAIRLMPRKCVVSAVRRIQEQREKQKH